MIFEIFSVRKKLRKLEKFSENIAKNFRNVSFLGKKNRAKNRNVRRDYVAMQQDVLLYNWAFFRKISLLLNRKKLITMIKLRQSQRGLK